MYPHRSRSVGLYRKEQVLSQRGGKYLWHPLRRLHRGHNCGMYCLHNCFRRMPGGAARKYLSPQICMYYYLLVCSVTWKKILNYCSAEFNAPFNVFCTKPRVRSISKHIKLKFFRNRSKSKFWNFLRLIMSLSHWSPSVENVLNFWPFP